MFVLITFDGKAISQEERPVGVSAVSEEDLVVGLDVIEYTSLHHKTLILFLVGRIGEGLGGRLLLFLLSHIVFLLGGFVILGDPVAIVSETVVDYFQFHFSPCIGLPSDQILLFDDFEFKNQMPNEEHGEVFPVQLIFE